MFKLARTPAGQMTKLAWDRNAPIAVIQVSTSPFDHRPIDLRITHSQLTTVMRAAQPFRDRVAVAVGNAALKVALSAKWSRRRNVAGARPPLVVTVAPTTRNGLASASFD